MKIRRTVSKIKNEPGVTSFQKSQGTRGVKKYSYLYNFCNPLF